jgi:hypothetical protein
MTPKEYQFPVFLVAALLVSGLSTSRAEENCLPAPNARAPQGSHWYYRINPASQNKCWHLRAEGQTDEQPIKQQKPEQAGTSAVVAPPPLPRPAPDGRKQRSNTVPTDQARSGASVGIVDPGAQSGAEPQGVPSGGTTWTPPPAPATNTNVWGDAPSGTVTAPALSSTSSDNAPARPSTQPSAAAENNAGAAPLKEKPNAVLKQQRLASDNADLEKELPTDDEASYKLPLLAMLLIIVVAGVIVVGMIIRALVRIGFARREAIAVEEFSADLPAEAEKVQASEGALRGLLQIVEYESRKLNGRPRPTDDRIVRLEKR